MKLQKLFYSVLAAAALLAGCKEPEEQPSIPNLAVTPTELSVAQTGGSAVISVTSNRAWTISTDADWIAFNPSQGSASDSPVSVTVTALGNTASDRTGTFKVKTDFDYRTVTVTQPGPQGVDPTQTATGKGTADDPYNTIAAMDAVSGLSYVSTTEYQTTGIVYVKGKISKIAENGTFTQGGSYGNASFYISPDGSANNEFYAYRILYLGNKKYKSGQTDIKVGDEVVICGKLMNFKGNTPETEAGAAYLYSLNGETSGGGGSSAEPKGKGTLEDPYNPAGANAAASPLSWTSNTDYQTTDKIYIKGKISRIADKGTFTEGGSYGNASFYITEDGNDGEEFYAYRILYLENNKFKSGQTDIKVGDEVIIYGKVMNYRNNTPETEAGAAYLYSLNGDTGGSTPGGDEGEPKGTGTLEDPYNPAGAAAAVKDLTWTDKDNYQTTDIVYVKGKISKIAEKGTFTEGVTYGNASFYISEDGTSTGEFYVFRTLYLGNKKYEKGQTDIKVGDEVIICGKLMNYRNDTPETEAGASYLYSLNGETGGGGETPGGDTEEVKTATVAEFIAASDSKTQPYKLTGKVSNIKSDVYGNFDLTDATGTIYVYGLVSKDLGGYEPNKANDKSFSQIGIKEGDEITIIGYRETFKPSSGDPVNEVVGSYYVSGASGGGGETPGSDTEEVKTATVAEFIAASDSKTQPYKLTGKVSNIKSDVYGNFDLTDATGTIYVYGLVSKDLGGYEPNKANDKSFSQIGIKEGDEITIIGYRETFKPSSGDPVNEVVGSYYVSGASGSGGSDEGEATGDFSSNVEWTKGENASDAEITVNGKSGVSGLKLGTSKASGEATIVLKKGTTSMSFYGVSWKGNKTSLVVKAGSKELFTQELAPNDGAANNSPFTMSIKDSDHYTKTFEALSEDTTVTLTTVDGGKTRVILFGINVK